MTIALCPGSFDPLTNGHVDVITRTAACFDSVVVGVVGNPSKSPLFSSNERVDLIERVLDNEKTVRVEEFDGLLVDYAVSLGASVIVKGLRGASDFEYEVQMAQMNRHLTGIDTVFIATNPEWSFVSSSLVKEVARLGGDIEAFVPPAVAAAIRERL